MRWIAVWVSIAAGCACEESGEECRPQVDDEELCGPCAYVPCGETDVTGAAWIDDWFRAVIQTRDTVDRTREEFEGGVRALAAAFGVAAVDDLGDYAALVAAAAEARIAAGTRGLGIHYVPPVCSADVRGAVAAALWCQADAGCEVPAVEEDLAWEAACEGECRGACSGDCDGECAVRTDGGKCAYSCEGWCDLEVGGACAGVCVGDCDGTCTRLDTDGACHGRCEGMCTGSCGIEVGGGCVGECHGMCVVPSVGGQCEGVCRGSCDAVCAGACDGPATPPLWGGGSCDVEVKCTEAAVALGVARFSCTDPHVALEFEIVPGVEGGATAFLREMSTLEHALPSLLRGAAQLESIAEWSDLAGPLATLAGLAGATLDDLPAWRVACLVPALEDAAGVVADIDATLAETVAAQVTFLSALGLGAP